MAGKLSIADRVRVMELISDYAYNLDGGYLDDYVGSFAPGGSLTNRTGSYDGLDVIRDYVGRLNEIGQVGPASNIRHFIGLPVITGDSEACHASAYLAISGPNAEGPIETYLVGVYELDFVKVDGDWRFKVRHSRMDLVGSERAIGEPITERSFAAPPRPADSMSPEDKIEVIDLIASYPMYLDGGDAEAYADNYTEDGVFESEGNRATGRAELADLVRRIVERNAAADTKLRHMIGLPSIRGDAQRCQAETYLMLMRQVGNGPIEIRSMVRYSDEIVRDGGRWRFARRTAVTMLRGD